MHTTASLHVHPSDASVDLTFEVRRLAKQHGCAFIATKRAAPTRPRISTPPTDGGHAA